MDEVGDGGGLDGDRLIAHCEKKTAHFSFLVLAV
jgi:hypothetical protein